MSINYVEHTIELQAANLILMCLRVKIKLMQIQKAAVMLV